MINIQWSEKLNVFICHCDYAEKEIPKRAGFTWDKTNKIWITPWAVTAQKLVKNKGDIGSSRAVIEGLHRAMQNVAKSNALYSEFEVPAPAGLEYREYQRAGVEFMRNRRAVLLGDEMGIGKTIQAIGLYNYHCANGLKDRTPKVLIICPATLKRNWVKEWRKWSIRKQAIEIAEGSTWPGTDIVVVNYDILPRFHDQIRSTAWDILIMDECQYLKNKKARRTQQVFGRPKPKDGSQLEAIAPITAKCKLALTGTPIPNRPIELYALLRYMDPLGWPNKLAYAQRYCNAMPNGFGWDMNGASNLEELQEKLRSSIMIRRLKKDVLKDLPPKERQIIEIEIADGDEILAKERKILQNFESQDRLTDAEYKDLIKTMRSGDMGGFEEMSTIRRENAVAKIPYVIEHLHEALDASGKVVVFCHHKQVAAALIEEFKDICTVVTGSTGLQERHDNVEKFQTDPNCRLFIGNIIAAGTGITLTASSHVVFAELDWVPGNVSQAEDRCHRMGQTGSVLVQHIVVAGSIDAIMAKTIVYKQSVIEKALDPNAVADLERALQ